MEVALDFGTWLGTLTISMIKYLHKIINEFLKVLRDIKVCSAGDNIFKVRDDTDKEMLSEKIAK